jgi:hypothetical protein
MRLAAYVDGGARGPTSRPALGLVVNQFRETR